MERSEIRKFKRLEQMDEVIAVIVVSSGIAKFPVHPKFCRWYSCLRTEDKHSAESSRFSRLCELYLDGCLRYQVKYSDVLKIDARISRGI